MASILPKFGNPPSPIRVNSSDERFHVGLARIADLLEKILLAVSPSQAKWTHVYKSAVLTNVADVVRPKPQVLHGWFLYNTQAAARYVKIFGKDEPANMGSDKPRITIPLPANGGANLWMERGIQFSQGMSIAVTTGAGDYDNTAPSAGDVIVNLFYE